LSRQCCRLVGAIIGVCAWALNLPTVVAGHQLDEFLGLTHINVNADRAIVSLSLTPGAEIVEPVIARIDRNRDGVFTADEQNVYVDKIRSNLTLAVDDRPVEMVVSRLAFPSLELLRLGQGVIHVELEGRYPRVPVGRHELFYANDNSDEITVYVVNALRPDVPEILIGRQDRDWYQRHVTIGFEVSPATAGPWRRSWAWALGAAVAVVLGVGVVARRRRSAPGAAVPPR